MDDAAKQARLKRLNDIEHNHERSAGNLKSLTTVASA